MLQTFTIKSNNFLSKDIKAFYSKHYTGMGYNGNPDYLNKLKNTYDYDSSFTMDAVIALKEVLLEDLPQIPNINSLAICVVPRAKAEDTYTPNQLLFKSTIQKVISMSNFYDGIKYIVRHTNTKTTHLPETTPNYNNDGDSPYPGITIETCTISSDVKGKDILLIDDVYTKGVNIDEDAIQALLNCGVNSIAFYAVAKA
ncbi:MAG: Amidophosphoribosyltransferase [uncultured Sulfurovum sp.]|uniref:Amidophosphoribosyltransferase n=1 Tax=uncultured Sulfurovum sp. TaxID=269237 RepID=A0A6S6TZ71_9BACT|nr:MAG: Amidophosphoribosyltransferase [uncultured Sulfurovum sp.]